MIPLNPFIQKNKPRLIKFIDNLSVRFIPCISAVVVYNVTMDE